MIHVRDLEPDDAGAIARLEARLHHGSVIDTAAVHRERLEEAIAEDVNLSLGAFVDRTLVGYVLCYGFEPTSLPDHQGEVLYIEDVAVEPRYRRLLGRLLNRFADEVRTYFRDVGVEAHCLESVLATWRTHDAWLATTGFALQSATRTGEVLAGEDRYVLRWAFRGSTGPADPARTLKKLATTPVVVAGRTFGVKVIRRESQWASLDGIWDRLLLAMPEHTVFQSYRYQRLWWKHFGGDSELLIVLILEGDEIVGIAPLRTSIEKVYGRYRREIDFIGSRWEVDRPSLLFPKDFGALTEALARFLSARVQWDVCHFYEQPSSSDSLHGLTEAFRKAGALIGQERDSDCPYLRLAGTWPELLATKSQKFRKNLKASRRRMQESGELSYTSYDSAPDVDEQLQIYRRIEEQSWKDEERVGVARSHLYFRFYEDMAKEFAASRDFVIRILRIGDRAVAGTFGLVFDGTFYSLQITHDGEFDRCSPGTYLESLEIEECFARGYREYDFLGGFLSNKSRWTSTYRYTTELHVYRRSVYFAMLHLLLFRIRPWVKELIRPFMKSWPQRPTA
jgi:CelD/BcsL family acetyltransferase involved in cellulose biosynthesis